MKILILGAQGNLGSELTKLIRPLPAYQLLTLDKDSLDVLDFNLLSDRLAEFKPDIIFNTVAYNAVDKCESDISEKNMAWRMNSDLPAKLAELAISHSAILVQFSSDYVFSGSQEKKSFTENDTPNPINKYGESKAAGEREIAKLVSSGLKYYLIRTSKLFGPKGSSELAKPNFFDIMLNLAQDNKVLRVVDEELSCFTYTPDLAQASFNLVLSAEPFGIYHLVNEGPATWYQAVNELFKLKPAKDLEIMAIRGQDLARPAKRPLFSILMNTKAPQLRNWQTALNDYLNNIKI